MDNAKPFHIVSPLLHSLPLSQICKVPVFMKMDVLQPSGSFKIRGIGHHCSNAFYKRGCKKLVSSSGGNAGLAVAYVGRMLNLPVTVVVPSSTLELIKDKLRLEGAEVRTHGSQWAEAHTKAQELASQPDTALVHPFDNPEIWEGHESVIVETAQQLADSFPAHRKPAAVVCSVGGGGLLTGIVHAMKKVGWADVPVLAVETKGADSLAQAIAAKELITLPGITSIAKTLGASRVATEAFNCTKEHKVVPIVVTDKEAIDAIGRFADDHRCLVEPACSASLAVLYNAEKHLRGLGLDLSQGLVVIVCGGSGISLDMLHSWRQTVV